MRRPRRLVPADFFADFFAGVLAIVNLICFNLIKKLISLMVDFVLYFSSIVEARWELAAYASRRWGGRMTLQLKLFCMLH